MRDCCWNDDNLIMDFKNVINSQNNEILKLRDKLNKLEMVTKEQYYKQCVIQEIKYYYELKKRDNKYRNLLKQLLHKKIEKLHENNNSYIII